VNNFLEFAKSPTGAKRMFEKEMKSRTVFYSKVAEKACMDDLQEDYFDI